MMFFFFNDTATTEIYTLSLHDALPISRRIRRSPARPPCPRPLRTPCAPALSPRGAAALGTALLGQALALLASGLDRSDVVERLLRKIVVLALEDLAETAHGVWDFHVHAIEAGELFSHEQRLGEEALDLARTRDEELVVV